MVDQIIMVVNGLVVDLVVDIIFDLVTNRLSGIIVIIDTSVAVVLSSIPQPI